MEIKKTRDYDRFSFLEKNRRIMENHVAGIVQSIADIGYLESEAIKIDPEYNILDGQHRFLACKRLDLPIHYYIQEGNPDQIMLSLNQNQRVWDITDYINLYALKGVECYIKVKEFEKKYCLGITNSLNIMFGNNRNIKHLREGKNFSINPAHQRIVEFLFECKNYLSFWKDGRFVRSVVDVFRRCRPLDTQKLQESCSIFKQQPRESDYIQMFENVLNKGKKKRINLVQR